MVFHPNPSTLTLDDANREVIISRWSKLSDYGIIGIQLTAFKVTDLDYIKSTICLNGRLGLSRFMASLSPIIDSASEEWILYCLGVKEDPKIVLSEVDGLTMTIYVAAETLYYDLVDIKAKLLKTIRMLGLPATAKLL